MILAPRDRRHDRAPAHAWTFYLKLDLRQRIQDERRFKQGAANTDIQQHAGTKDSRRDNHQDAQVARNTGSAALIRRQFWHHGTVSNRGHMRLHVCEENAALLECTIHDIGTGSQICAVAERA